MWRRRPALAAVRAPSERRIEEQVVSDDSLARACLQKRRVGLCLGVVRVVDEVGEAERWVAAPWGRVPDQREEDARKGIEKVSALQCSLCAAETEMRSHSPSAAPLGLSQINKPVMLA